MKQLRLILLAVLIGTTVSVGAYAQKGGNDNRPPKDTSKVVDKDKEKPPPPSNTNRRRP